MDIQSTFAPHYEAGRVTGDLIDRIDAQTRERES